MQVTKGTWRMREQCVPGSLSSSPAQEPGNEASVLHAGGFVKVMRAVAAESVHKVLTVRKERLF